MEDFFTLGGIIGTCFGITYCIIMWHYYIAKDALDKIQKDIDFLKYQQYIKKNHKEGL